MALRFCALASGSAGNSMFMTVDGFGLLIDAGLGPRQLGWRLASIGASWGDVHAVLLTHTHSDHWRERTLQQLVQRSIPLYCHAGHQAYLQAQCGVFRQMLKANLVRSYHPGREFMLDERVSCRPIRVNHDSEPTFGFRLEGASGLLGEPWAVGYLADLGCWSDEHVEAMTNVDVLALEFNHDEHMERTSNRPIELIDRVLSDCGHLSNMQAAEFVRRLLVQADPGPTHLIQLHLSRECNRPTLAQSAARAVLAKANRDINLHTASQDQAGPVLTIDPIQRRVIRRTNGPARALQRLTQPSLPGLD
jgi:ribonuclease BN (tRNA processing enzyme)